jgi:hypothetical protein
MHSFLSFFPKKVRRNGVRFVRGKGRFTGGYVKELHR